MELICHRALAVKIGAVDPLTMDEHRQLRDQGALLIRDPDTSSPLFWRWQEEPAVPRSS